ncbi:MAG: hypothetical protein Q8K45_20135 [Rubrivivax sp.]|nr:hypothetical protein [Rubrivivax sp.]
MRKSLFIAMASAGLLAACGGGGGGSDAPTAPVTPPSTAARVTLTGLAAKGLMANADVTVLAVNADGTVSTTVLGTATTSATGTYSVVFDGTSGVPYVVRITAKADGSTTHLDEVLGSQPLPSGFTLRALGVPASSGALTVSTTVTPFSEMAAAAAARATGGITAANTAQAKSTVSQLLGFDPLAAPAPSTAAGASATAQQLAVMLTAVSRLAADGGLGCTTGSAGDKTRCVTEALAAAASTTTIKLESGATDVSAVLGNAVTAVLADPALAGAVAPSTLVVAQANLACSGSTCTAAPATGGTPPGPSATALAIAASKQLFTEIRADFASLFSRGGVTATAGGAANVEAWKFNSAMQGMQVPVDVMAKDLGVLLTAADLYNDFMANRSTLNTRGGAPGEFDGDMVQPSVAGSNAVACSLYADTTNTVLATTPAQVVQIGCRALYFVTFDPVAGVRREWRHGFTITPGASGSFAYTTRARLRTTPCVAPACTDFNLALQTDFYAGTLNTTVNASGNITAFNVDGRVPGAFVSGSTALYNGFHELQMQGTRTISGFKQELAAITGTLKAYDTAGALQGTLTLREGSNVVEIPITDTGTLPTTGNPATQGTLSAGTLVLAWTTPTAEFEGKLSLTDSVWDSSGTAFSPQRAELTGSLRTVSGGVASEFLSGSFVATISGYATHNATLLLSPTNRYTEAFTFTAAVTAPNRPRLELSAGASKTSDALDVTTMTLQYRSVVNGAPRIVVGATTTLDANGLPIYALTETSANLRMEWRETDATSNLFQGTTLIGKLNNANGLLTFVDGSFISLDAGL